MTAFPSTFATAPPIQQRVAATHRCTAQYFCSRLHAAFLNSALCALADSTRSDPIQSDACVTPTYRANRAARDASDVRLCALVSMRSRVSTIRCNSVELIRMRAEGLRLAFLVCLLCALAALERRLQAPEQLAFHSNCADYSGLHWIYDAKIIHNSSE